MVEEVRAHLLEPFTDPARASDRRLEGWFVDGTVGLGGHATALLESRDDVKVLGLDRDPETLELARARLAPFRDRVRLVHASYADLAAVVAREGVGAPLGVLLDLGVSSVQLDDPRRGFSFRAGTERDTAGVAPDMRFDRTGDDPTALDLVNHADERTLADLLWEHGEEPRARAVARSIVRSRPFRSMDELVHAIRGAALRGGRIDPATRSLQGLRIAVNDEMGHLERGLSAALGTAADGARVVAISRVKHAFREAARVGRARVLTKKPIRPTEDEVRGNPRARPARLRAAEVTGGA
jgi:16S rRNA (cytosine1402-N4)-methyltransferase